MNAVNYLPKIISLSLSRGHDRSAISIEAQSYPDCRQFVLRKKDICACSSRGATCPLDFRSRARTFPFFPKSRRLNTATTKVESWSSRTAGLCYLRSAIRVLSNAAFTVAYTPARIPFSLLPNPIDKTRVVHLTREQDSCFHFPL